MEDTYLHSLMPELGKPDKLTGTQLGRRLIVSISINGLVRSQRRFRVECERPRSIKEDVSNRELPSFCFVVNFVRWFLEETRKIRILISKFLQRLL